MNYYTSGTECGGAHAFGIRGAKFEENWKEIHLPPSEIELPFTFSTQDIQILIRGECLFCKDADFQDWNKRPLNLTTYKMLTSFDCEEYDHSAMNEFDLACPHRHKDAEARPVGIHSVCIRFKTQGGKLKFRCAIECEECGAVCRSLPDVISDDKVWWRCLEAEKCDCDIPKINLVEFDCVYIPAEGPKVVLENVPKPEGTPVILETDYITEGFNNDNSDAQTYTLQQMQDWGEHPSVQNYEGQLPTEIDRKKFGEPIRKRKYPFVPVHKRIRHPSHYDRECLVCWNQVRKDVNKMVTCENERCSRLFHVECAKLIRSSDKPVCPNCTSSFQLIKQLVDIEEDAYLWVKEPTPRTVAHYDILDGFKNYRKVKIRKNGYIMHVLKFNSYLNSMQALEELMNLKKSLGFFKVQKTKDHERSNRKWRRSRALIFETSTWPVGEP